MADQDLPPQTLAGKTTIVTGSARGLGAEMAFDLAIRGAQVRIAKRADLGSLPKVVVVYTSVSSTEKAEKLVEDINALPNASAAISVRANLGEVSAPRDIIDATIGAFGKDIHILVNNAAVQITRPLSEISHKDYDDVYNVNVRGVILMTQATLKHMPPKSRIINISSVGGRSGFPSLSLYTSSKAALEGLTRSWAAELGSNGTTVNAVAPGPVQSEMLDSIPKEIVQMQKESTPVEKRVGMPYEVSNVVSWLASEESAWISGQTLNVSGGWTMY
ncbi:hypothetical protein LTR84_013065 [Exophiala bonariae]|uniref:Ketoreductase domain-containing protein n=1 Tax=Exophiala bonariae TaxID=1690606 RepID=A0AAV9NG97_9EURO|nr:hypothetical protein LTR84_013065 [Exophiala bonariae]